jgi:hypothetical protein
MLSVAYTYLPNSYFASLNTLPILIIYFRYKPTVSKLVPMQITVHKKGKLFFSLFILVKYSLYKPVFMKQPSLARGRGLVVTCPTKSGNVLRRICNVKNISDENVKS